jgi:hypothetical protein
MFYTIEPSIQQCQVSEFEVSVLRGNRLIWGLDGKQPKLVDSTLSLITGFTSST